MRKSTGKIAGGPLLITASPIETPAAGIEEMSDIGAVIPLARHNQRFRPDHLFGWADFERQAQNFALICVFKPSVIHRCDAVA